MTVAEGREGRGWRWMEKGLCQVVGRGEGNIRGGGLGHVDLCGEPAEGIDDAFRRGVADPDAVAAIVVESGAKIPAIDGVGRPGFANIRAFVDHDAHAGWCKGCAVEVEGPVDLRISR